MNDLDQAAARAAQALEQSAADPAVEALLASAADGARSAAARRAELRLLGALAGEAFVGPRIVQLDPIGVCNLNCVYCRDHSPYAEDREPWRINEMPHDLAVRLIDEAVELGAELIPLVGAGENTLHSQFARIVTHIKRRPVDFEIYTNGLFWNEETIALLADAPRAKITFSISAATPETWAAFRPEMSPRLYEQLEATVARLIACRTAGLRVGIVHVLNKRNFRELLPMIDRAVALGVDEVQYKLTEINRASRPLRLAAPELASIALEIREARRRAVLAGVDIHDNLEFQLDHLDIETGHYTKELYDRTPCFAGLEMVRVRRDGAYSFCCGLKFFGNAHAMRLAEHWCGEAMRRARRAALAMPRGGNLALPGGGMLRDGQCDYCYNYILNETYRRRAQQAGVERHLTERR